jgi:acetyltransferase-like isoleucine patch superfamily enzyme
MGLIKKILNKLDWYLSRRKNQNFLKGLGCYGANVSIRQPVCFEGSSGIEIGNDVSIAAFVHMWGHGGIKIGSRVMIGSHSAISTITHDHTRRIMYGTIVSKPIVIQDDVWIGAHSVIMPGVTLKRGAVVGAGAVVTKDVPEDAIVMGVPAQIVKFRKYQ